MDANAAHARIIRHGDNKLTVYLSLQRKQAFGLSDAGYRRRGGKKREKACILRLFVHVEYIFGCEQ